MRQKRKAAEGLLYTVSSCAHHLLGICGQNNWITLLEREPVQQMVGSRERTAHSEVLMLVSRESDIPWIRAHLTFCKGRHLLIMSEFCVLETKATVKNKKDYTLTDCYSWIGIFKIPHFIGKKLRPGKVEWFGHSIHYPVQTRTRTDSRLQVSSCYSFSKLATCN